MGKEPFTKVNISIVKYRSISSSSIPQINYVLEVPVTAMINIHEGGIIITLNPVFVLTVISLLRVNLIIFKSNTKARSI